MTPDMELRPFGEASCEDEVQLMGEEEYSRYYFEHTRFNAPSLDRKTFLIVGRRGSGKTSLGQHFSFQKTIKHAFAIDVNEPELFKDMMRRISGKELQARETDIPRLADVWNFLIWQIIFFELKDKDPRIKFAAFIHGEPGSVPHLLIHALKLVLARILATPDDSIITELENLVNDDRVKAAKEAVLEIARKMPVIVAVDTLENYSVENQAMMNIVAALIQCASDFNRDYSNKNIHLKIFVMAEVFPYLKEEVLLNPLKHVHDEVYLHWRPKDLLRLISWRLAYYLQRKMHTNVPSINWDDFVDVHSKFWEPLFGKEIKNGNGLTEKTFPYVLRHTQMRPRQLILLCNNIAKVAGDTIPEQGFSQQDLLAGIQKIEDKLSGEVINSYNTVYPNVGRIVDALSGFPVRFKGSELDKRAPMTASQWNTGREYSPSNFRQLVAELGIVGRIRSEDLSKGFIEADFEYATEDRLPILSTDDCVIHPLFFRRLNVKVEPKVRVYPFPNHPEFKDLEYWQNP